MTLLIAEYADTGIVEESTDHSVLQLDYSMDNYRVPAVSSL